VPLGEEIFLERQRDVPLLPPKKTSFYTAVGSSSAKKKRLQVGTYLLLIITSTGDELYEDININKLERP